MSSGSTKIGGKSEPASERCIESSESSGRENDLLQHINLHERPEMDLEVSLRKSRRSSYKGKLHSSQNKGVKTLLMQTRTRKPTVGGYQLHYLEVLEEGSSLPDSFWRKWTHEIKLTDALPPNDMIFWENAKKVLAQKEGSLPDGVKDGIQSFHKLTQYSSMFELLEEAKVKIKWKDKDFGDKAQKKIDQALQQKKLLDGLNKVKGELAKMETETELPADACRYRHNGPIVKEADMVGREAEMEVLLDHLVEGESWLTVVSIVGRPGLGKTTLAAEAYNSVYVKNYFDCRAWVSLSSSEYEQEELLDAVMKAVMPLSECVGRIDKHDMLEYLTNKRYIIVFDDVQHSNIWKHLSKFLPDDRNGSRALITTTSGELWDHSLPLNRRLSLQQLLDWLGLHRSRRKLKLVRLEPLNRDESWELLCKRVFEYKICAPELEVVGKSMAGRCRGFPLTIMLLGGLLSEKEENDLVWKAVDNDLLAVASDGEVGELNELLLYFTDLPTYLKLCFLYFGVFPLDFEISTRHLFQLWIAEGFIRPHEISNSEGTAEYYLEQLIDRGLIQALRRRSDGTIKTCRIHDLQLSFAIFAADELGVLQVVRRKYRNVDCTPVISSQRLAAHERVPTFIYLASHASSWKSLLCVNSDKSYPDTDDKKLFQDFKLLRVLDLGAVVFTHLPDEIENLFHLRYLRLNAPDLDSIPSQLCSLRNLYTLDMPFSHINHTPHDIWKMQSLRHLYFHFICLPGLPPYENDCHSLRHLNFISTLCPSSCTQDVLGRLPNLRTLRIYGDLSSHHQALSNNLSELHCLESLKLVGDDNLSPSSPVVAIELRFPQSLTHLTLCNTGLSQDPMPALEKLPNLRVLKLKRNSYWGKNLACSSKGFPRLQVLHLKSMQWLEEWTMETDAMSSLVCLVINPCAYLRRLPEELWNLKSFSKVELWWPRPELKPRIREIEDMDRYDVQIYPSGM